MREVILMQSNKKEPKSLSIGIWKQMFPFFRPYRKEFATTFSLNILLILVDVAVPAIPELCDRSFYRAGYTARNPVVCNRICGGYHYADGLCVFQCPSGNYD